MPAKRKTLPKDFDDLLTTGHIEDLKKVFDTCGVDAHGGFYKTNALGFDKCPHDLAKWLVDQGADINHISKNLSETPLQIRSSSWDGNIESLLKLGADVNAKGGYDMQTALHAASSAYIPENTRLLLQYNADPNAINNAELTPLDYALRSGTNSHIEQILEIAQMLLKAGATVTKDTRQYVVKISERFEFYRDDFNEDTLPEIETALKKLCLLFDVTPAPQRKMHDGKSPIILDGGIKPPLWKRLFSKTKTTDQHYKELWGFLVPAKGSAGCVQGETVRILGRMEDEILRNGGINWGAEYNKMANAFVDYLASGKQLSTVEMVQIKEIVADIKQQNLDANFDRLRELVIKWISLNPHPIPLDKLSYRL